MNILLILSFLFFIGSLVGWCIEVVFRRFFSAANPERKWINPGFLVGPYLPLYGFSLCTLYLLAHVKIPGIENPYLHKLALFVVMALVVTFIEYLAGLIFIKGMKVKLWDYDNEWGNIQGIICPKFTVYWMILSAIYYFFIHPNILDSLQWLSVHLTFSFFVGFFYGVICIDFGYSCKVMATIRKFAVDHDIIVKYNELQRSVAMYREEIEEEKERFLFGLKMDAKTPREMLLRYAYEAEENFKERTEKFKEETEKIKDEFKKKSPRV